MPADSRGPSCPWARRQGVVAWGSLSQPAPATVGPTYPPPPRRAGTSLRWGRDGVQARGRALISGWGRSTGPPSAGRSKRLPVQDKGCASARWQGVPPAAGRVAGSPGVGGSVTMPLPRSHVLEFASGPHWLALPTAWSLSLCTHGPAPAPPQARPHLGLLRGRPLRPEGSPLASGFHLRLRPQRPSHPVYLSWSARPSRHP